MDTLNFVWSFCSRETKNITRHESY